MLSERKSGIMRKKNKQKSNKYMEENIIRLLYLVTDIRVILID